MLCNRRDFVLSTVGAALAAAGLRAADPAPQVRIGMPTSMFRDVNPAMMASLQKPFNAIVRNQTGLSNEMVLVPTAEDMRENLETGKVQLAVFYSYDYAWASVKQPALQPLMVVSPLRKPLRYYIAVSAQSKATSVADLKGKGLAIPSGTREYGRLYVDRQCRAHGSPSTSYFSAITTPADQENALHDAVDNKKVQAALVDIAGLDSFASRHPVRNKRLRILTSSEPFPPSVVAYHKGSVDDATLRRFRDGMSTAHNTAFGKQLLAMWNLAAFEAVPSDYAASLAVLAKAYPPLPDDPK